MNQDISTSTSSLTGSSAHQGFDESQSRGTTSVDLAVSISRDNEHDGIEEIDAQQIIRIMSSKKTEEKSSENIPEGQGDDAPDLWDELVIQRSIVNKDYRPPCPWLSNVVPYCCIMACCCCWSRYDRQQCSLNLLYTRLYLAVYILCIQITVVLLCYDLSNGSVGRSEWDNEPMWFISLDIFCIALMVFDIVMSILASGDFRKYFKKIFNIFDFFIVAICVVSVPVYWMTPDWTLSTVLLLGFVVRILRVGTVVRQAWKRRAVKEARDTIVDFTKYSFEDDVELGVTKVTEETRTYGV